MTYRISKQNRKLKGTVYLTASKSESNRVLLVEALSKQRFRTINLADSQDTQILAEILKNETSGDGSRAMKKLNIEVSYYTGAGGTTIRFLSAFFAARPGVRILTGSERMNQRPIKTLVDSLIKLGAKITYLEKDGFPPVRIEGRELEGGELEMDASVSSQFITAILLIGPTLKNGLTLKLKGRIVSSSYIRMTLKVLEHFGIKFTFEGNTISIPKQEYQGWDYNIESDWSAASYWYQMAAFAEEAEIKIKGLKRKSIQGDSVTADLFRFFGVSTEFIDDGVILTKTDYKPQNFAFDFADYPDIAQTAAVTAGVLKIHSQFNGLHTLRIKETDRIQALITELKKIGVKAVETGDASIEIHSPKEKEKKDDILQSDLEFKTYQDHRMAMSFAPLALIYPEIKIENPTVVKKSYPDFWIDMKTMGFELRSE